MRSFLTSLGVIIGVGSVIIMVALGEGSQRAIEAQIAAMGTNLLQVMPARQMSRGGPGIMMRMNSLTKADLQKLKDESSYAAAVAGTVQRNATVVGSEGSAQVNVTGVEPEQLMVANRKVDAGIFISEDDLAGRNRVAVLGRTTAASLFGEAEDALDQQIRIGTDYYTVIGLLESKGAGMGGQDQDDVVMIPLDTAMYRLANSTAVNTIMISAVSKEYMEAAQKEAEVILRESRKIADGAAADFSIMNQTDMIGMATATSKTLTSLLAAIAGVSLLVGGIGIMNIMLVSVTERTREIGIRMAVGGRKRDILMQFLTESVILSLLGGIIGIGIAFGACRVMASMNIATFINPVIVAGAALFAALVGIIFGYSPAQKAARLYPIDALRYE
jgi:putative ABC transport system permease protein